GVLKYVLCRRINIFAADVRVGRSPPLARARILGRQIACPTSLQTEYGLLQTEYGLLQTLILLWLATNPYPINNGLWRHCRDG
ncbi:MAG: hypothetical protein ABIZ80_13240, partial [Bryobacteraceae bacterium]